MDMSSQWGREQRGSSRPGASESENGPLHDALPAHNHLLSFPPPRSPLVSIPDPSQHTHHVSDGPAVDSSAKLAFGASPRSATQSTPTRTGLSVSSSRHADRRGRERGTSSCRALGGGEVDARFGSLGPATCFELAEDPLFWRNQNVQVLIRIRPVEGGTQDHGRCVRQESSTTLTWTGHPQTRFTFDNIACESTSQEKLFMAVGLPLVENCLSGYNSCMFAYGQTGSGKTYTMMGDIQSRTSCLSKDRGMTPRIFEYLFTRIQEEENNRKRDKLKYNCKCSFLEIHNEQITDLLDTSATNLQIREDAKKGVHVENLREFEVNAINDIAVLLLQGTANRKVAATNANSESSRSHTIFTCTIESQWERDGLKHIRYSRLNLVDLAGSERQKSSHAEGERLKEAANINKSLSTLSLVIMILVDVVSGKQRHIPYRDSKLTFLLQDSLGGNSKTIIIANINPSICSTNETLSTLKFAQRAKLIQNNAMVNEDASGDEVSLQRQIQILKDQLTFLIKGEDILGNLGTNTANVRMDDMDKFQNNCEYSSIVGHQKPLMPNSEREKMAEDTIRRLEAEIECMNLLASEREDDAQRANTIVSLQEEKIKRLELLADGLVSPKDYLAEENKSLSKENQFLREKINRNPKLTNFSLENVRLLNQLRKFEEFYKKGEHEMLLVEINNLRTQLLNVFERKQWQALCAVKEFNEDAGANQYQLQEFHTVTPQKCDILEEANNFRKRSYGYTKPNTREAAELHCNLKKHNTCTKAADVGFLDMDKDNIKSNGKQFPDEDKKHVKSHGRVFIENLSLHAKLQKMQSECVVERNLGSLQNHHASQTSLEYETEAIQDQVCKDTVNTVHYFQEEKQKLWEKLEHIMQENVWLLELVSAKETELSSVASGWEKAVVCLTSFLVDGCQSLEYASEEVEHIMDSFPNHKGWISEHVEKAMNAFLDKEKLIFNLQTRLEDAKEVGLDIMSKMDILRGATLAVTNVQQEEHNESEKELLHLRRLLTEKSTTIQNLENLVQYMESKIAEVEKKAIAAFIIIKRLHETGSLQCFADKVVFWEAKSANKDSAYEYSQIENIKSSLMEINKKLNRLRAGIEEHDCLKDIDNKSDKAIDAMLLFCNGLREVHDHLHTLIDYYGIDKNSHSQDTGDSQHLAVQTQDQSAPGFYFHFPSQCCSGERQPSPDLLVKFTEAQETIKEADFTMNTLLELNENTKQEKDKWKKAIEDLQKETSALTAEMQELRASASLAGVHNNFIQQQIHECLLEQIETLSCYEESFQKVQEETANELKFICANVLSFGKELFQCISTSSLSFEAMLAKIMEKEFTLSAVYQCYLDKMEENWKRILKNHQNNEMSGVERCENVEASQTVGDEQDISLNFEECDALELKHSTGTNMETGLASNLHKNVKSSRSSIKQSDIATDKTLLRKELSRNDVLMKGLYFDCRSLQESASCTKYINDETECLIFILNQMQLDLSNKSAQVDEILVRERELESLLAERGTELTNSRTDLKHAKETMSILCNENNELKALLDDVCAKSTVAEQQIKNKDKIIDGLEKEILCLNTSMEEKILSSVEEVRGELQLVRKERDNLQEQVVYLNDKLEMACTLANENEAIAVEARQISEETKVYAQQKEEEVRVLECSIQELEETIEILERKVHGMLEEVEAHQVVKGDLEQELLELKQRMHTIEAASGILELDPEHKIPIPRKIDEMVSELHETKKQMEILELDKAKQAKEYKKHISELVLHSEAQSALYQKKYNMLEAMVHEAKSNPMHSNQVPLTANKVEKGSARTRGSGSPFKCIASIIQQMNAERNQELSVAQVHIEELETLADNRHKKVCKLTARLEAVDHMTHDVIRDLLDVKLHMTNYAHLLETHQLKQLIENARQSHESNNAKDKEIMDLRKHIDGLLEERESWIEEIRRMKAEVLDRRVARESIQRQNQLMTAENEILKMEKANLNLKIKELDDMLSNLVGPRSLQGLIQQRHIITENPPSDDGLARRLAEADKLLTHAKSDRAKETKARSNKLLLEKECN